MRFGQYFLKEIHIHEFALRNTLAIFEEVDQIRTRNLLVLKAPNSKKASPIMLAANQCRL
jgi:hypothetical protein